MEPAEISAFLQSGKRVMVRCRTMDQTMVYGIIVAYDGNGLLLDEDPPQEGDDVMRVFIPWHEVVRIY